MSRVVNMRSGVVRAVPHAPAPLPKLSRWERPVPQVSSESAPPSRPRRKPQLSATQERLRDYSQRLLLPFLTFAVVVALWQFIHLEVAPELPSPVATLQHSMNVLSDPFLDNGPNEKGIGWQLLYSLGRVMAGFGLAVLVGIPVGFLMGASRAFDRAWQPLIQILRPVSPLAWLPIGLLLFKAVDPSAIAVIFITCIWPTLVNTAAGVRAIPEDYMNVARVLRLSRLETARKILLPSARPFIITGMRLSLSIAWMVIVAAEMLTGGIGIGFYVWDEWNNLNVMSIILAIVLIGLVGIALEAVMSVVQRHFDYTRS